MVYCVTCVIEPLKIFWPRPPQSYGGVVEACANTKMVAAFFWVFLVVKNYQNWLMYVEIIASQITGVMTFFGTQYVFQEDDNIASQ